MQEEQKIDKQETTNKQQNAAPLGQVERLVGRNDNGVILVQSDGHATAKNATCICGNDLIVAPGIFNPQHKKCNYIMVCTDHGVHAAWFKDLHTGRQRDMQRSRDFR